MSFFTRIIARARYVLLYGFVVVLLACALKWMQWRYFFADSDFDLSSGLLALFFTALGVGIAVRLVKPWSKTVVVEKEVTVPQPPVFTRNEAEFNKLGLSNREYEILEWLAKGHSNAEIAEALALSVSTVKTHLSNLFFKLDVKNRGAAIEKAKRLGVIG